MLPIDSSMVFHAPADLDVDSALKKEQMALLGNAVSVKVRVKAKPPFSVLSVDWRSGDATFDVKLRESEVGVGTIIRRAIQTSRKRAGQVAYDLRGAGFAKKYRIVPRKLLMQRVLKYAVRLREQSLRATEAVHKILSHQSRLDCVVCKERFAAFHPAYEPPNEV